jgi:hypothetical protein
MCGGTVRPALSTSLLDVMDSFAVRTLRGIAQMVKLLGAECVVVGIQPDVALSMVQLGLRKPTHCGASRINVIPPILLASPYKADVTTM